MKLTKYHKLMILGALLISSYWMIPKINKIASQKDATDISQDEVITLAQKDIVRSSNTPTNKAYTRKAARQIKSDGQSQASNDAFIDLRTNYYEGLPEIEDLVYDYQNHTSIELREIIDNSQEKLKLEKWIERANNNTLSHNQMQFLAELMLHESAARLALLKRELSEVEEEFL